MITLFSLPSNLVAAAACPDEEIPTRKMVSDLFNEDQGKLSSDFRVRYLMQRRKERPKLFATVQSILVNILSCVEEECEGETDARCCFSVRTDQDGSWLSPSFFNRFIPRSGRQSVRAWRSPSHHLMCFYSFRNIVKDM